MQPLSSAACSCCAHGGSVWSLIGSFMWSSLLLIGRRRNICIHSSSRSCLRPESCSWLRGWSLSSTWLSEWQLPVCVRAPCEPQRGTLKHIHLPAAGPDVSDALFHILAKLWGKSGATAAYCVSAAQSCHGKAKLHADDFSVPLFQVAEDASEAHPTRFPKSTAGCWSRGPLGCMCRC